MVILTPNWEHPKCLSTDARLSQPCSISSGVLLSSKKCSLSEPNMHQAEWKKSDSKATRGVGPFICLSGKKPGVCPSRGRQQSNGGEGLAGRQGWQYNPCEGIGGTVGAFYIVTLVLVLGFYMSVKTLRERHVCQCSRSVTHNTQGAETIPVLINW